MDETKKAAQLMLLKFMAASLKRSKICVTQPLPLVEEKAQKRLSTDDLISWKVIMKEWEKVSPEGKKEISKLLTLTSYDLIECMDMHKDLLEDAKDTADYVKDHPEFEKPESEIEDINIMDEFRDILE